MAMCEADTQYCIGGDPNNLQPCSASARVCIDGINLCLIHAGRIAVRKLIGLKLAEVLPSNYCSLQDKQNF